MNYKRIIIDGPKLKQIIDKNYPRYNKHTVSYFSIFVTLSITLSTIEQFKDFGAILSSVQIKYILLFLTVLFLGLTLFEFFRKAPYSKESVISEIEREALNITKEVALFIFMKDFTNAGITETKLLFSDDYEWSSYLLPFCKTTDNHSSEKLCRFIESQLSLNTDSIKIKKINNLSFIEEKSSATSGKMTQYSYTTYFVLHDAVKNDHLNSEKFNIGQRVYKWLSLEEVKSHSKTMYLNRKVIRMIDDNFSILYMDYKLPNDKDQVTESN